MLWFHKKREIICQERVIVFKKSIRSNLIASFVSITIVACLACIVSIYSTYSINEKHQKSMQEYGFTQGDVGRVIAQFCRIDGNLHDAIGYFNQDNKQAAYNNVHKQSENLNKLIDTLEPGIVTEDEQVLFDTMKSAWQGYYTVAVEIASLGRETVDPWEMQLLQNRLVDDIDPLYIEFYNAVDQLMVTKVEGGTKSAEALDKSMMISGGISIVVLLGAVITAIVISQKVVKRIMKPLSEIEHVTDQMAQGNMKVNVDYHAEDELGVVANSMREMVTALRSYIDDISDVMKRLANGDLNATTTADFRGDFVEISKSIVLTLESFNSTLTQIASASEQVNSGSEQVASGAQSLSQSVTEQASSIQQLAATVNEISNQVQVNADYANSASERVSEVGKEVLESNAKMKQLIEAMDEISNSSTEIAKIIKTIEDIAFQTNLLALNAAVEAARAGTAGKGFAVVADEVRNLASKSADASKDTSVLIENSLTAVQNGVRLVDETSKTLDLVVSGAEDVTTTIEKISQASMQQADAINQITIGVDQISSVVQTNSATAEQSAAASEELSSQALLLQRLVAEFKLKKQDSTKYEYQEDSYLDKKESYDYNLDSGKY